MKSSRRLIVVAALTLLSMLLAACGSAVADAPVSEAPAVDVAEEPAAEPVEEIEPTAEPTLEPEAPTANLVDGCVTDYAEGIDYFPEKVELEYAENFSVEYHDNYKVIDVLTPWPGSTPEDAIRYVLVQCGTPAPEGFGDATVIEVPIKSTIVMSTTQLPHVVALDVLDQVVGIETANWTNSEAVVGKVEAGEIAEVGDAFDATNVNVELIVELDPDVVMTFGSGMPDFDAYPKVQEAGVPVAMNAEHTEWDPVGRAEWIKFTAMFFNKEAAANAIFDEVAASYEELAALTADLPEDEKPLVLPNSWDAWTNSWIIPGRETYVGKLFDDAGARLVLADDPAVATQSGYFDFEAVYDAGLDADIWIAYAFAWYTLDDVLAADPRHADFKAYQTGEVYNNTARVNTNGGNDWYESGVMQPDVVLADLIKIIHPELMDDTDLFYYVKLTAGE